LRKADGAGDTDVEPEKGALSDAFKRAAVRWGIGRYLYGIGPVWVSLEPEGDDGSVTAIAPREFARLRRIIGAAAGIPRKFMDAVANAPLPQDDPRGFADAVAGPGLEAAAVFRICLR
jgi:hypothetical protein